MTEEGLMERASRREARAVHSPNGNVQHVVMMYVSQA
jgi:hypothetical protein